MKTLPLLPIRRTRPRGEHLGLALPAFIHNGFWFLAEVEVYADGAIYAWGGVDRSLFRAKVRSGWVDPQPADGGWVSVHNLGDCVCRDPDWRLRPKDLEAAVDDALERLGPAGRPLLDLQGEETERRDGISWAKLGLPDTRPVLPGPPTIDGAAVPVFHQESERTVLTHLFIFADGRARVGTDGDLLPAEALFGRLASGDLRTTVADGVRVTIPGLGEFTTETGSWTVRRSERLREARALLAELQGAPGPVQACRDAHARYVAEPTDPNREALRAAYAAVPAHLRMYCGDMDTKDHDIRRILRKR